MEYLKNITKDSPPIQIATYLKRIYKKICNDREKKIPEAQIKEIEFLQNQLKSENVQLSIMSAQMIVKLVESSMMDGANAMSTFLILLNFSNSNQYHAITEGVISLLLLSLKRKVSLLAEGHKYECQFSVKSPQHPLISLIQDDGKNITDVINKLNRICNHHDKEIRDNSIEFLRPVYLYIFCSPQILPNSKAIWSDLISQSSRSPEAVPLFQEILCWSKLNTPSSSLFLSSILVETVEHYLRNEDDDKAIALLIHLSYITKILTDFGFDPRPNFQFILRCLHKMQSKAQNSYNVLLIILSEILHNISPFYLGDILRIFHFIIIQKTSGNQCVLNMILDGIMMWLSQPTFVTPQALEAATKITDAITRSSMNAGEKIETEKIPINDKYFHPDIAIAFNLAKLAESFEKDEYKFVFVFIDALNTKTQSSFCGQINYFLRSLFLLRDLPVDCWFKIYQMVLSIVKSSEKIALDFIMTFLFKLARETNPEAQLELLKGLPQFAVAKDNIPMILNTLKLLCSDNHLPLCIDLHLRLWKEEVRTFPFLLKLLSLPDSKQNSWEFHIAKASAIKDVFEIRPEQYISDLVPCLNETLITDDDLATSIALDAIVILCKNNCLNILSTWGQLNRKFDIEQRFKTAESLCNFFAQVPLLVNPGPKYDGLIEKAINHFWNIIQHSDNPKLIRIALKALRNFKLDTVMNIGHIPAIYREGFMDSEIYEETSSIDILELNSIPGDSWIQLMEKIHPKCIQDVADLISHYIELELQEMKSWQKFSFTHQNRLTVLGSVINYLVTQSRFSHLPHPLGVTNALRSISKKFSRPLPSTNVSFLPVFLNLNFEARKYCILIALYQMHLSETAKRLLATYLTDFEPNCFAEDLLFLLSISPELAGRVPINILKPFVEKISAYCFTESQLNGFTEGCLFEKFLESVKYVFVSKCDVQEALDVFTTIIEHYLDAMVLDSRLFETYTDVVSTFSPTTIDRVTSPSTWWEVPIGKLKKAMIIRCYLVLYNREIENPLTWLSPIIDAFTDKEDEHEFFFRHLTHTLHAFNDEKYSSLWVSELIRQIQTLLIQPASDQIKQKFVFLLNVLVLSITTFSGCALLLGSLEIAATSKDARMALFPESLQILFDRLYWKENEGKSYEFFHYLYKHSMTPDDYCDMLRNSIICSRNRPYFEAKTVWTKYVGLRK